MLFDIDDSERTGRVALIDAASGTSWTYSDLARETAQRSAMFGGKRGLLLAFCRNDLESVAWYLAAMESGSAVALLSDRLDAALRDELIARYRPDWIYSSQQGFSPQPQAKDEEPLHPALGLLLSTSGSTGSPKFVRLTRVNVVANAGSIAEALGIATDHRAAAHLPIHYSYGLSVLNSHLHAGASVLLLESSMMANEFWQAVRSHEANSFSGVPYNYQMLKRLNLDKLNVPGIRIMTQAGGKLDPANIAYFHSQMAERNGTFWPMYGQTEATARIAILNSIDVPRKPGSAGQAVPGGRLSILAEGGETTVAAGVEGELVYEGPNVMLGYAWGRDDLAKADELHGRLETGDRARLDDEGFVYILGRAKRDAKVFGLRVNLDEVEGFVRPHGAAAAIAGPNGIRVFCEFAETEAVAAELSAKLKIHRSGFEFRTVQKLPVKETGKIDYGALEKLL